MRAAQAITGVLQSRFTAVLLALCGSVAACVADGSIAVIGAMAVSVVLAFGAVLLNKQFNLMRSTSVMFAGIFVLMQGAMVSLLPMPMLSAGVTLVLLWSMALLFRTFGSRHNPYAVLSIFFILSTAAIFEPDVIWYIPVFVLGLMQMRLMHLRTIIAAAMGLAAPRWIAMGFGLMPPDDGLWPAQHAAFLFDETHLPFLKLSAGVLLSALVTVVCGVACSVRSFGYNSQGRAYNGFIFLLSAVTIVLCLADMRQLYYYVTTLNFCAAYQLGHMLAINEKRRAVFVPVLLITVLYAGLLFV